MRDKKGLRQKAGPALAVFAFILVFAALQQFFIPKYQGTVIEGNFTEEYYRDPTWHELLIIGNCESYENISTMKLWEDFGITSYIRGNANQLVSQSYYLLMEALEREQPKAVLFNVQAMTVEGQDTEEYNRMVFDGMNWSRYKWEGIRASAMEGEEMIEYLFPLLRYHSRWQDLEKEDFLYAVREKPLTSFNGYYLRADVRPAGEFPRERRKEDYTFPEENYKYLDLIRQACEDRGIPLILMKAPSLYPEWADPYERQILIYAAEHNLTYWNLLEDADKVGLDMSRDTYDEGLHLNVYGAEKVSAYLGPVLKEQFGLSDYRRDPETASYYNQRLAAYKEEKARQEAEFAELGYIKRLAGEI